MLGLAATAALAAMAFVGASSASANSNTALCTVHTSLDCGANVYTGHVEATAKTTALQTSVATVLCETSTILGNALGLATAPTSLTGHLELVNFNDCETHVGVGCTVTTTELGLLLLLKIALNKGLVESYGTWVKVQCLGVLHCEYGGTFHVGTALGSTLPLGASSLGLVHANAEVQRRKALFESCPLESKWTALYTVQLPHDLFILR